jgi:hypothetical protein
LVFIKNHVSGSKEMSKEGENVTGVTLEQIEKICEQLKKKLPIESKGYIFTELEIVPQERKVLLKASNGTAFWMSFELVYFMNELASIESIQKDDKY